MSARHLIGPLRLAYMSCTGTQVPHWKERFRNALHLKLSVEIPKESYNFDNLDAFEGTAESKIVPVHTMAACGREGEGCRCTVAFILRLGSRRR